eukprot:3321279-Pleurochrysis_carterae.AAC.2
MHGHVVKRLRALVETRMWAWEKHEAITLSSTRKVRPCSYKVSRILFCATDKVGPCMYESGTHAVRSARQCVVRRTKHACEHSFPSEQYFFCP